MFSNDIKCVVITNEKREIINLDVFLGHLFRNSPHLDIKPNLYPKPQNMAYITVIDKDATHTITYDLIFRSQQERDQAINYTKSMVIQFITNILVKKLLLLDNKCGSSFVQKLNNSEAIKFLFVVGSSSKDIPLNIILNHLNIIKSIKPMTFEACRNTHNRLYLRVNSKDSYPISYNEIGFANDNDCDIVLTAARQALGL